jgi:hypothetical protein
MENHKLFKVINEYESIGFDRINGCSFEDAVNNALSYYKENFNKGSKEFCLCARALHILDNETPYNVTRELFDSFITTNQIDGVGDYFEYLYLYIKKFGNPQMIWECGDSLLQNYVFKLSPKHKKYIEYELIDLHKKHVCERVLHRIISQTQGVQDVHTQYKVLTNNNYSKNYKYYPF